MALSNVTTPYDTFTDQQGKIISSGKVYIGLVDQDPQTNPQTVYWDDAGTIVAAQPLQIVNGYIVNSGTPAQVFVNADYSIRVFSQNTIVYEFYSILAKTISGPAGGDLTGNYPNPTIKANAVTATKIADNSVTTAKLLAGANNTVKGTFGSVSADISMTQLASILPAFVAATPSLAAIQGLVPSAPANSETLSQALLTTGVFGYLDLAQQTTTTGTDSNGIYFRIGNIKFCFGTKGGIATNGTATVTFPNSGFSGTPYQVILTTHITSPTTSSKGTFILSGSPTATGFTAYNADINGGPTADLYWLAVGLA